MMFPSIVRGQFLAASLLYACYFADSVTSSESAEAGRQIIPALSDGRGTGREASPHYYISAADSSGNLTELSGDKAGRSRQSVIGMHNLS